MAGFVYAPFGDLDAVARLIDPQTAAILIEPVQGEGGIRVPPDGFLAGLRKLADEHGLLLVFDEVQTGCGRSGQWFAYQHFGVTPDIMTLAKAICGGLPGAAMLARPEIAPSLRPGMHACTFGGNPIAAAAGLATIEMIERENLLERARQLSALFARRLEELKSQCEIIREVRVVGLLIGIELAIEGAPTVKACMERGLLVNCTHGTVIRLLPAMTLREEQLHEGCDILGEVLKGQVCDIS
jgi:acetylornithine/succinyldiaminopimelate/putrescine aminotransferase